MKEVYESIDDQISNWPFQRYGHTVAASDSNIYLFGGRNDKLSDNDIFVFDTNTHNWNKPKTFGNNPPNKSEHASCIANGQL